ncbi:hypothetical protein [Actinoplanes rectilineatus]|uniref:hypothetical protein n=1 Tax=Actinoplanes rectilineatus TaxID=113571 RepID=UPI0005F2F70C|nr:hypothetical protein [Actinoplanes rectilineatus]
MAQCATGDAVYFGTLSGVMEFFDSGIDGILAKIATAIMTAAANLFEDAADKVPTLAPNSAELNEKIGFQINWLVLLIAVASLLFAAGRMALERRGQAGMTALKGILRVVLVAGAGSFVLVELATLSDHYTSHLYEAGVKAQLKSIASCGNSGIATFLLIIIGLLLLISGVIHIILLYLRLGVMTLLFGTLPLAASASMTEWGSSWWRKHIAWMVAWLAYKPAVGLVLYAGTTMIAATGTSATQQKIAGCGVLLLSAVALPALLRLIVPAMAALGSGDPTRSVLSAGAAATGAVATAGGKLAGMGRGAAAGGGRGATGAAGAAGPSAAASSGAAGASGAGGARGASTAGSPARSRLATAGRTALGAVGGVATVAGLAASAANKANAAVAHGSNIAHSALPGIHDGADN